MNSHLAAVCLLLLVVPALARDVDVRSDAELTRAMAGAAAGDVIRIAAGEYKGGLHLGKLRGTADMPITIQAADRDRPPVIKGGSGLHLIDPAYVHIRHIIVEGSTGNGINLDDGGDMDQSAVGVELTSITVRGGDVKGNFDGIKLSGLRNFKLTDCTVENWSDGGSGIDMVGCADGTITGCTLKHKGNTATANGIQAKGGSRDVTISFCRFDHAGQRGVNLGGSTGPGYFRPALKDKDNVEATRITVKHGTFIGCQAPVAFVTSSDCVVENCVLYRPGKWAMRILQEQSTERFLAAQGGRFAGNVIIWQTGDMTVPVNVGANTKPQTFKFEGNWWYCVDRPENSRPKLPVTEQEGRYGENPEHVDREPAAGDGKPLPAAER
ncbi:MAG: right-handed parallel beta-helix repeat-containing protein [Phycisphaeraceae bacterium]